MIVQCPHCLSRYRLDESRVSKGGLSLRCTKCQEVFQVSVPPPDTVKTSASTSPTPRGAKKILVGDDAPFFRTLVSDILKGAGFTVETAADGGEVISKVASYRPDLLILDLQLPDMSGFEVIKNIRRGDILSQLPILAMSAVYTETSDVMALEDIGANDYIGKKFKPEHLVNRVEKLLERASSARGM